MTRFADIDLSFEPHPVTGDLVRLTDHHAIKQSMKNLILMNQFESPFRNDKAGNLRRSLFDLGEPHKMVMLKERIKKVLENHEPRIMISDVQMVEDMDNKTVNITVIYSVVNSTTITEAEFYIKRTG